MQSSAPQRGTAPQEKFAGRRFASAARSGAASLEVVPPNIPHLDPDHTVAPAASPFPRPFHSAPFASIDRPAPGEADPAASPNPNRDLPWALGTRNAEGAASQWSEIS